MSTKLTITCFIGTIFIILNIPSFCQTVNGFRGHNWGESVSSVKDKETQTFVNSKSYIGNMVVLYYTGTIHTGVGDFKGDITYQFIDDKLLYGSYNFEMKNRNIWSDYRQIQNYLSRQYSGEKWEHPTKIQSHEFMNQQKLSDTSYMILQEGRRDSYTVHFTVKGKNGNYGIKIYHSINEESHFLMFNSPDWNDKEYDYLVKYKTDNDF